MYSKCNNVASPCKAKFEQMDRFDISQRNWSMSSLGCFSTLNNFQIREIQSVAILQMHRQMHNSTIAFVNKECEYRPNRFIAVHIGTDQFDNAHFHRQYWKIGCPKTTISLPFVTYLQMYFMGFTELQYSTLQCVLNVLEISGEYETFQLLSIMKSILFTFVVII